MNEEIVWLPLWDSAEQRTDWWPILRKTAEKLPKWAEWYEADERRLRDVDIVHHERLAGLMAGLAS